MDVGCWFTISSSLLLWVPSPVITGSFSATLSGDGRGGVNCFRTHELDGPGAGDADRDDFILGLSLASSSEGRAFLTIFRWRGVALFQRPLAG